jgi:hypothetical protein
MNRIWGLFLAIFMLASATAGYASADSTCYPDWKIKQTDRNGCSSTALLSPGNDTRVNLLMLLHDRHGAVGQASRYAYDIPERRGEAEPFDWPSFAMKLGPSQAPSNSNENFNFGTRCMSSMAGGAEFIAAVAKAKGLSNDEKATLTAVRMALKPECAGDAKATPIVEQGLSLVKSKPGRTFANYLIGAASFYDGNFGGAQASFAAIGKTDSAWLKEAAAYMLGRNALNEATLAAFDEYGGLSGEGGNKALLAEAETAFKTYLKSYPTGQYAPSARGLLRRVYWLGKDRNRLLSEYAAQFATGDPAKRNLSFPDLVQEIDIKLLGELKPEDASDPMLLAVLNLRAMRHANDPKFADYETPPITRAALDAQRPKFAGNEALFAYLQAVHAFYVANKPAEVLKLIPVEAANGSYLGYSRQLLRAVALDAIGDSAARPALIALIAAAKKPHQRGSTELALALHDERSKAVDNVFASNSAIRDPDVREILLRYHAGPALLRKQAAKAASEREQQVAIFTLLYKDLTRGAYGDFLRDLPLVPANARPRQEDDYQAPRYTDIALFRWTGQSEFVCPSLKAVATTLSANPKDAKGQLCLGEFIRSSGLDPDYYGVTQYLDDLPDPDELGGTPSLFPGKRFSRLDAYKAVMTNPAAGPDNRAYALYRAVNCYAPAGYNGCDSTEATKAQRKGWFDQLKGQYPTSVWAKKLRYYW